MEGGREGGREERTGKDEATEVCGRVEADGRYLFAVSLEAVHHHLRLRGGKEGGREGRKGSKRSEETIYTHT
jgi:hypothetical protein